MSAQLLKNEVVWIKRDGQKAVLENPLQILVFEKESLQAQGKWADKNEKYYTDIVKPLLEEDNVIQEQQDRDHVPAVGQAEDIDTKIFLPSPSPSPAATA